MSDIKNPFDSLQDYFDDLLPSEDIASATSLHVSASVKVPNNVRLPISLTVPANLKESTSLNVSTASPYSSAAKAAATLALPPPTDHRVTARRTASKAVPQFAEPDSAKKEKLQKLLSSAQPKIVLAPIVAVEVVAVPVALPNTRFVADSSEIQEWAIATAAPIVEIQPSITTPRVIEAEVVTQRFQMPGLEWLANGLPQWAQSRFDVLLFKVAGLTLAVPLISLGQIQPITDELTPLFGQADWYMGIQPTPQGKIHTVNTAKFVMPERYHESFVKNAKYVVSINGVPWGLAVDSVNQPIRLKPDDVKWRGDRSKRPWLAGTVKEHMCALLDIPMIGQILIESDKNAMKTRW